MPATIAARALRLVLLAAAGGSLAAAAQAQPQAWGDDPPPPSSAPSGYAPYQPPYQPPYGYAPQGYAPQPYYGYAPYQDPYAAERAWRRSRRQAEGAYDQANAPAPNASAYAPPPPPPSGPAASERPEAAPSAAAQAPVPVTPPPAPTSVALANRIVESASAYLGYIAKASAISPAFADGAGVAKEVKTGAAYEPKQFEEGAIAYAAIVALQEPAFVQGVRSVAATGQPEAIAAGLLQNPASAAGFPGADAAAARAAAALRRQGDRLLNAGAKVKQAAYDVQHSDWSKGDVAEPEVRLAGAKTLSATRLAPAREETDKLLKIVLAEQGAPAGGLGAQPSPVVARGLALAALAVMGQAGEDKMERVSTLLAEERGGECLKMAKLNLFQCLAVAGPHYEDIFCLGQHAMMDTAQCVIKASGVSPAPVMTAAAAPAPTPITPASQDYQVPLGAPAGDAERR